MRVRVPATSANLGPGFDAFGLALGLHDELVVSTTETGLRVVPLGEGAAEVPCDERHLVVRAMRRTFEALGGQPAGLDLRCTNRIPHGRGLGSSAAAIIAGAVAARALVVDGGDRLPDAELLAVAAQMEGHPDNVAACLYGGFTLAWTDDRGPRAVRLTVHDSIEPVVLVPEHRSLTEVARTLLPASVPHADAAANAARAALLVEALARRPEHLLAATEDRLHQRYRAPSMAPSAELLERLRTRGHAAVVSGSGPTLMVLGLRGQHDDVRSLAGAGWRVEAPGVDHEGAVVAELAS